MMRSKRRGRGGGAGVAVAGSRRPAAAAGAAAATAAARCAMGRPTAGTGERQTAGTKARAADRKQIRSRGWVAMIGHLKAEPGRDNGLNVMADAPRYRFGPLERRGMLAGSAAGPSSSSSADVTGLCRCCSSFRTLPIGAGARGASLVAAIGALRRRSSRWAGRTPDEWLPVVVSWVGCAVSADDVVRLASSRRGLDRSELDSTAPDFPRSLSDVVDLVPRGSGYGPAHRRAEGPPQPAPTRESLPSRGSRSLCWTAPRRRGGCRRGRASSPASRARAEPFTASNGWSGRFPIPATRSASTSRRTSRCPLDSALARSYLEVVDQAGPVTQEHEVFVALQIHAGRSGRAVKAAGGGDPAPARCCAERLAALSIEPVGDRRHGGRRPHAAARRARCSAVPSTRRCRQRPRAAWRRTTRTVPGLARSTRGRWRRTRPGRRYRTDSGVARHLLDRGVAADRRRSRLPGAALLLRTEAMRTRVAHDGAGQPAQGDPHRSSRRARPRRPTRSSAAGRFRHHHAPPQGAGLPRRPRARSVATVTPSIASPASSP